MTPEQRLAELVTRTNTQFVLNAERLRRRFADEARMEISPTSTLMLLTGISHELSTQMTKHYGLSYTGRQLIRYRASLFAEGGAEEDDLFDLVLHETGHQWCDHFLSPRVGHGHEWQWVGWIVGYVPIGSTKDGKRRRIRRQMVVHRTFAAAGHFNPLLNI